MRPARSGSQFPLNSIPVADEFQRYASRNGLLRSTAAEIREVPAEGGQGSPNPDSPHCAGNPAIHVRYSPGRNVPSGPRINSGHRIVLKRTSPEPATPLKGSIWRLLQPVGDPRLDHSLTGDAEFPDLPVQICDNPDPAIDIQPLRIANGTLGICRFDMGGHFLVRI